MFALFAVFVLFALAYVIIATFPIRQTANSFTLLTLFISHAMESLNSFSENESE